MHVDSIKSPFALWGTNINKQINSTASRSANEVKLSANHFPSTSLGFRGDVYDERFLNAGGFNFNGSKLNYLA